MRELSILKNKIRWY